MKPVCNFCGDAVVYHLNGSRNKCEKCGGWDGASMSYPEFVRQRKEWDRTCAGGFVAHSVRQEPETEDPCGFSRWVEKMKQLF